MNLPNSLAVDTSVLIDYLRDRPGFKSLALVDEIYLPAMGLAELQIGWARAHTEPRRQIQRFDALVRATVFLPILRATVSKYVEIRRALEVASAMIPENDLWIAAAAMERQLPLLTLDAHFQRVPGLVLIAGPYDAIPDDKP